MADWPVLSQTKFGQDDITFNPYVTTLTPNAATHTKSVYTQIVAATAFDVAGILFNSQLSAGASNQLLDIAIGAAASEQIIVPNVLVSVGGGGGRGTPQKFIPIFIRKGSRIAFRFQSNIGSQFFKVKVLLLSAGGFAGFQPPNKWEGWGVNLATSAGVAVTASGSANTKGAYAELIAATGLTSRWVILGIGIGTVADMAVDIAIGAGGSEVIVLPNFNLTNENVAPYLVLPWTIPKGTRLAARCAASSGGASIQVHMLGGA